MATTKRTVLELTTVGGDKVLVDLNKIGDAGQRAFQRIIDSTKPVSGSFRAVDSAVTQIRGRFDELADKLGPASPILRALGPGGLLAAGAAGAAAGLFAMAKSAIDTASAMNDSAERIGVNVEALQELQFAASQAGISHETLEANLGTFVKRLGEAKQGQGELVSAFKEHNAALLEQLRNTSSLDEALDLAANAIAAETDATKQAALANDFFGKSGRELLPILREGADALDRQRQAARDLGLVLSSDTIKAADEAGDKLSALADIAKTRLLSAMLNLVGPITTVADKLLSMAESAGRAFSGLKIQPETGKLTDQMNAIRAELQDLESRAQPEIYGQRIEALREQLKKVRDEWEGIILASGKAAEATGKAQLPTIADDEARKKAEKDAARERERAAQEFQQQRKQQLSELERLEDEAAKATLDRIAFVNREEQKALEEKRQAMKKGLLTREELEKAETAISEKYAAERTKIVEEEEEKKAKAREGAEKITKETEKEITKLTATESDRRRVEFEQETDERLAELRKQLEAAGNTEEEITAKLGTERANRQKLYDLQEQDAKKSAEKIKISFSSIVGELTTGILEGSRDWEDGFDLLKDAGIGALGQILEQKLKSFDPEFESNFVTDLPGFLKEFASKGLGIFGGFFDAILGQKEGFISNFAKGVGGLFGGGGDGASAAGVIGASKSLLPLITKTGVLGSAGAGVLGNLGTIASFMNAGGTFAGPTTALTSQEAALLFPRGQVPTSFTSGGATPGGGIGNTITSLGNGLEGLLGAVSLVTGVMQLFAKDAKAGQRALGGLQAVLGASSVSGTLGGPTLTSLLATYAPAVAAKLGLTAGAGAAGAGGALGGASSAVSAAAPYAIAAVIANLVAQQLQRSGSPQISGAASQLRAAHSAVDFLGNTISGKTSRDDALKYLFRDFPIDSLVPGLTGALKAFGQLSKAQVAGRFLGPGFLGELSSIGGIQGAVFSNEKLGARSIAEVAEKFPEQFAAAGKAAQAFGSVVAPSMRTGINNAKEVNYLVTAMIANFGKAGLSGEESLARVAGSFRELGIDVAQAGGAIEQDFNKRIQEALARGDTQLAEQLKAEFQTIAEGLVQIASVSTDQIVAALESGLNDKGKAVFARMKGLGLDAFQSVTAAGKDAWQEIAAGLSDDLLGRGLQYFELLRLGGVSAADSIQRTFNAINFKFPGAPGGGFSSGQGTIAAAGQFFIGESGKLIFGTAGPGGEFQPLAAPELSAAEQSAKKRELGGSIRIPGFATGGIVPGAIGAPMIATVHGGEAIFTPRAIAELSHAMRTALEKNRGPEIRVIAIKDRSELPGDFYANLRQNRLILPREPFSKPPGVR